MCHWSLKYLFGRRLGRQNKVSKVHVCLADLRELLARAAEITSIPTLMAFREGIMVFRCPTP